VWKHIAILAECLNQSLRVIKEQDFFHSTLLENIVHDKTKKVKFEEEAVRTFLPKKQSKIDNILISKNKWF